ncbi:hypothetical protein VF21_08460 [Pseudogymnoascus sp. 05NY08]|nr:hypothetical protein VF21_08460 [Pseudogymnoascus sp. 05NY08]
MQTKEEQAKSVKGKDCDEDEGFDDREDGKGVEGVEGAAEEVDKGFKDEMSKETKWMQQIQREDKDNAVGNDLWDLQAGHGTHIAGMIYACELMEGNNTIISRREKFRQGDAARGTKCKRLSFKDKMDEVQAQQ